MVVLETALRGKVDLGQDEERFEDLLDVLFLAGGAIHNFGSENYKQIEIYRYMNNIPVNSVPSKMLNWAHAGICSLLILVLRNISIGCKR